MGLAPADIQLMIEVFDALAASSGAGLNRVNARNAIVTFKRHERLSLLLKKPLRAAVSQASFMSRFDSLELPGDQMVTFEEFVSVYGCSDADFARVLAAQKPTVPPAQHLTARQTGLAKVLFVKF